MGQSRVFRRRIWDGSARKHAVLAAGNLPFKTKLFLSVKQVVIRLSIFFLLFQLGHAVPVTVADGIIELVRIYDEISGVANRRKYEGTPDSVWSSKEALYPNLYRRHSYFDNEFYSHPLKMLNQSLEHFRQAKIRPDTRMTKEMQDYVADCQRQLQAWKAAEAKIDKECLEPLAVLARQRGAIYSVWNSLVPDDPRATEAERKRALEQKAQMEALTQEIQLLDQRLQAQLATKHFFVAFEVDEYGH